MLVPSYPRSLNTLTSSAPSSPAPASSNTTSPSGTWTLADRAGHGGRLSSTSPGKGYADAGVVVDFGPASDFTGVTVSGSQNLAEIIWITDGSQATVPGTHPLSLAGELRLWPGRDGRLVHDREARPLERHDPDGRQIRTDFAGYQVWAWVGIDDSGTTDYG